MIMITKKHGPCTLSIRIHPVLWEQMSRETKDSISEKEREFLRVYNEKLGGL